MALEKGEFSLEFAVIWAAHYDPPWTLWLVTPCIITELSYHSASDYFNIVILIPFLSKKWTLQLGIIVVDKENPWLNIFIRNRIMFLLMCF